MEEIPGIIVGVMPIAVLVSSASAVLGKVDESKRHTIQALFLSYFFFKPTTMNVIIHALDDEERYIYPKPGDRAHERVDQITKQITR